MHKLYRCWQLFMRIAFIRLLWYASTKTQGDLKGHNPAKVLHRTSATDFIAITIDMLKSLLPKLNGLNSIESGGLCNAPLHRAHQCFSEGRRANQARKMVSCIPPSALLQSLCVPRMLLLVVSSFQLTPLHASLSSCYKGKMCFLQSPSVLVLIDRKNAYPAFPTKV